MISNVIDLTGQLNNNGIVVYEAGGFDYYVIQTVNISGTYFLYATNDGGAIESIRDGGLSPKLRCTTTSGSTLVTTDSTAGLSVGDKIVGVGIPFITTIANIVDETSFNLSSNATQSINDIYVVIFAKNFLPILAENLETGTTSVQITADGNYRINSPMGKYLILQVDFPTTSDKVLLFSSKIY